MDFLEMEETDAFYDSCRTRALHEFNDDLEQSLELTKDVFHALVQNKLISNQVMDILSGPSLDNEAKVQGVLFNIKKNMTEDKFNRFLSVIESTGLRHIAKAIWKSYSERANVFQPKTKHVGCQTENNVPTKLPIKERQKLYRIYDKLNKGLKGKHGRRFHFDNSPKPDENSIRIEDVDREIDKLLEVFHEQIHYIAKFCDKLGLHAHELPTVSQEIEKLVGKCKTLEAKVNSMSVNSLFSQYFKEETSASSFSSTNRKEKNPEPISHRTSTPVPTLDLQTTPRTKDNHIRRSNNKIHFEDRDVIKKDDKDIESFQNHRKSSKQTTMMTNGFRIDTTRTSAIMQTHLSPFEIAILESKTRESVHFPSRDYSAKTSNHNSQFENGSKHPVKGRQADIPRTEIWKNLKTRKQNTRATVHNSTSKH